MFSVSDCKLVYTAGYKTSDTDIMWYRSSTHSVPVSFTAFGSGEPNAGMSEKYIALYKPMNYLWADHRSIKDSIKYVSMSPQCFVCE